MALISKIRKNFWLVLIVLGLALASFVMMDIMGSNNGAGGGSTSIGEVMGQKIDLREFERTERALFNSANTDLYSRRDQLWDYMVEKTISSEVSSDLGLGVSKDELIDLLFGINLSPIVQSNFTNSQTGVVDRTQLQEIRTAIETGQDLGPDFRLYWSELEKQVANTKVQEKITNVVSKGMYTPSWLAELDNKQNSETATFQYVKIPYNYIDTEDAALVDSDFAAYLSDNEVSYSNDEETRVVDYVSFSVVPTPEDSAAILEGFNELADEFKVAPNDSLFATNNAGGISLIYSKPEELQEDVQAAIVGSEVGDLIGPYTSNGNYVLTKVVDKRIVPDSVSARHILKMTQNGEMTVGAAKTIIDSIRGVIESGAESFETLASRHSDDPGSKVLGGDVGTFVQGTMVLPFNNACFIDSEKGGLYTVVTDFGVHLIEVTDRIFNDRDPKYKIAIVSTPIIPSDDTQNSYYDRTSDLLQKNRDLASLKAAVEGMDDVSVVSTRPVGINDHLFQALGGGETTRSIVKWAHKASVGEVSSSIYEYQDEVNYFTRNYVIAGLSRINSPGLISVDAAREVIRPQVLAKKKGAMIKDKMKSTDLEGLSSEFGMDIDSVFNVTFNGGNAELGSEPKIVAAAHGMEPGQTSGPIEGNTGIYLVRTSAKSPGFVSNNLPSIKESANQRARSSVNYGLWNSIKKVFGVEDNRAKFF